MACYFSIPEQNSLKGNGTGWKKHFMQFLLEVQADTDLAPDSFFLPQLVTQFLLHTEKHLQCFCTANVYGKKCLSLEKIISSDVPLHYSRGCHGLNLKCCHRLTPFIPTCSHSFGRLFFCSFRRKLKWSWQASSRPIWFSPACFPLLPLLFNP